MALVMLNTLKSTRLLNVFHPENYTKTWNVKWCPLTTMWTEIQHHSRSKAGDFTLANCGTDSMAKAHVWNQALSQHPLGAGPLQGCQQGVHSTARTKGHIPLSCLPLMASPCQSSCTEMPNTQCPCLSWSALTRSCQKTKQTGKLQKTPTILTNRWKPVRTKLVVIKKMALAKM